MAKEKKTTKLCKHCKTEIPAGAKICPSCQKKQGGIMMWFIIGIVAIAIIGGAMGKSDSNSPSESKTTEKDKNVAEVNKSSEEPKVNTKDTKEQLTKEQDTTINNTIKNGSYDLGDINILFSDSVRDDVTKNWRLSKVSTEKDIAEYALNYYNTFFSSDNEIHAIVNFSNKTTNRITKILSDKIQVTTFQYIKGEEHSAKELFGGKILIDRIINTETGEIEEEDTY